MTSPELGAVAASTLTPPIRVMVVDDHPTVRRGIRMLLDAHAPRFLVVAEAGSAEDALASIPTSRPDVVLTDLQMKPTDGLTLMKWVRQAHPDLDLQFVVFTASGQKEWARASFDAGARGFVVKDSDEGEVVRAIEAVVAGYLHCSAEFGPVFAQAARRPVATLREREVLACIADGLQIKAIARRLGMGVRTVETHRSHLIRKFELEPGQLVKFAVERRWEAL